VPHRGDPPLPDPVPFLTSASETSAICSIRHSSSISRIRSGAAASSLRRQAGAELALQLGVGGLQQDVVPALLPKGGGGLRRPQELLQPPGHDAPLLLQLRGRNLCCPWKLVGGLKDSEGRLQYACILLSVLKIVSSATK